MFTIKIKKSEKQISGLCENGITIYNKIISSDTHSPSALSSISRALLVFALSFSSLAVFSAGIDTDINYFVLFLYTAFVTAVSCSFNSKAGKFGKIALILLFILFIIFTPKVKFGFCSIINDYTEFINLGEIFAVPDELLYTEIYALKTAAMCEIATLIVPALSYSCFYSVNLIIVFLCTFPFAELILYWGIEPPTLIFIILITGWVCVFVMQIASMNFIKTKVNSDYRLKKKSSKFYISSKKLASNAAGKTIPVTTAICSLLFIFVFVYSSLFHSRPGSIDQLRSNIKYAVENFSFDDIPGSLNNFAYSLGLTSRGNSLPGTPPRLGERDGVDYTGKVVLKVRSSSQIKNNIYLKGYVGSVYTDNTWLQTDESDYDDRAFSELDNPVLNINYNSSEYMENGVIININSVMEIENVDAPKYAYAPYNSDYLTIKGVNFYYDSYAYTNENNYSVNFLNNNISSIYYNVSQIPIYDSTSIGNNYRWYLNFANNHYTDYNPELISTAYNEIISNYDYLGEYFYGQALANGYDIINNDDATIDYIDGIIPNINIIANAINHYFQDNYTYNIAPGRTPSGEDFVKYFLEEMDSASCTYFASAGTLLMRSFGFPARYVEGFIVTPDEFNSDNYVEVTDRSAHAWCEVYIDGTGWVPLEFTPGFSGGENPNLNLQNPDEPPEQTTTAITTTANTTSTTTIAPVTTEPEQTTSPVTSPDISGESDTGNSDNSVDYSKIIKITIILILVTVAVLVIILCWLTYRKKSVDRYLKSIADEDRNKAVIAIYRRYVELLKFIGINTEINVTDLDLSEAIADELSKHGLENIISDFKFLATTAVEADMSSNKIIEENYRLCLDILKLLQSFVWDNSSTLKKFILKYIRFYY